MRSNPVSSAVLTLALSFGGFPARAATSPFHKIAPAEGAALELGMNDTIHFSYQIEWNAVQAIPAGKPLDIDIRVYAPCCGALLDVKVPKGSSSAHMSFAQLRAAMQQRKLPESTELMWEFLGAKDSGDARKFRVKTKGKPDLMVSLDPDFSTVWPKTFAVKNIGNGKSEDTLLRVKVEVLQGDLDVVKANCKPKFTDFDEVVSELGPGDSRSIKAPVTPVTPAAIRFRPGGLLVLSGAVPTPNPVQQVVACQYEITAELAQNHNLDDMNRANDTLTRKIRVDVPLK